MPRLDQDVQYAVVREVASFRTKDISTLRCLSETCRSLRNACLPVLFAEVQWPHPSKHDEETGLHFFPTSLWPLFKCFSLVWPDHWPDATPPLWGDKYYIGGDYHPRNMDKLVSALPFMTSLSRIALSCPFYPPNSIFNALIECPSLRDLSINDTPLYMSMIPRIPPEFHLERLSLVPVAEALRVGEGPYDAKYHEVAYYIREYRRKYKNDVLARYAASAFLFQVGKTESLKYVQISGDLCTLDELSDHQWPNLQTLVLTGHPPRTHGTAELVDVIAHMPQLHELRLLFAKAKSETFRILPAGVEPVSVRNTHAGILGQIKYLAMSNACNLENVFLYTTSLERLAICAIIDLPRVPIALNRGDIDRMLRDMARGASSRHLRRLRVMLEDKVNPELCLAISMCCPMLEALELELCGYHDGKSIHAWSPQMQSEFADAFSTLTHLRELRICIQFPEYDEADRGEPWRTARRGCALYMAGRLPTLQRVGFEYRKRTGTHRYEDCWLEYDIERRSGGEIEIFQLMDSWYPFPEVWHPVSII